MKALVLHAHPNPDSFNRQIVTHVVSGLRSAGHDCEVLDLYGIDYRAHLTRDEHVAYSSSDPILDPVVAEHAQLVRSCEMLVFVYPTWWSSIPAILKGLLERTLVRGVAFDLDEASGRITPLLRNIRHIVGVTTHGSPWWYAKLVNDNGRRTITRSLRVITGLRVKTTWLALYSMDSRSEADRRQFLDRVELVMSRLKGAS